MGSKQQLYAKKIRLYRKGTLAAFEAFCKDVIKITGGDDESGDTSAIPFKWWPSQRELAAALCDPEVTEIIIDKSRQIGITWLVLAWQLWRIMFWFGIEERITSVGEKEAAKALRRVKFMIDHMPDWIRPTLPTNNTETIRIEETGSWLSALPATANAGRGDTLNDILLDECAFQLYASDIADSATPSLEKRHGKIILNSTANGSGNYFQQTFVDATEGNNGFKWFFFGWQADPSRDDAWYAALQKKYKKRPGYVEANYPRTWQESFTATGRPYFTRHVKDSSAPDGVDLSAADDDFVDGFLDGKNFIPNDGGCIRVWKPPVPYRKYVMFADVAEGLEHGDFDNAYVMDVETRELMARIRGKMPVGDYADVLMQVGEWYGCGEDIERVPALLAIEANNHGIAVTKHCADAGYRNLYYERDMKTKKQTGRIGWMTSAGMMGSRGVMLGNFQTEYLMARVNVKDRDCLEEMALFAHRGPRGKAQAPPGKKDDCVMSFAGVLIICEFECPADVKEDEPEVTGARLWALEDLKKLKAGEETLNEGLQELGG